MTEVTSQQGDTVASLCYRHYGYTKDVVEKVLEANVKLAQLGSVLPTGTKVRMPPPPVKRTQQTVQLWD